MWRGTSTVAIGVPTSQQSGSAVVNIDGVKFKVSDNGRKLNRMELTPSVVPPRGAPVRCSISRKLYVEGEEYVEDEDDPGTLVRSRNSMTRASITNARNRSINTILKSQTRSKQYCMFFNKFGNCETGYSGKKISDNFTTQESVPRKRRALVLSSTTLTRY